MAQQSEMERRVASEPMSEGSTLAEMEAKLIAAAPFIDVMREMVPEDEKLFTWWSYRAKDWRASNRGRRLDHIWVTDPLRERALASGRGALTIHDEARGWERPSDHAPVTLDLAD